MRSGAASSRPHTYTFRRFPRRRSRVIWQPANRSIRPALMRFRAARGGMFRGSKAVISILWVCRWRVCARSLRGSDGLKIWTRHSMKKRCSVARSTFRLFRNEEKLLLLWLGFGLRRGIVLLAIDVARSLILLPVDLLLFAGRQRATIGFALGCDLLVNSSLLFFELCGFGRRELAALDALRNAGLLVLAALPDLVVAKMRSFCALGLFGLLRRCCSGRRILRRRLILS